MNALEHQLSRVEKQLSDSPYDIAALSSKALLKLALERDARGDAQLLARMTGDPGVEPLLAGLAAHQRPITPLRHAFIAGGVEPQQVAALDRAIGDLDMHFEGHPKPTLLIEFAARPTPPTFAHVLENGFGYICFSSRGSSDADLYRAAVHELAHTYCFCRHRYFDEAFATYWEAALCGDDFGAKRARLSSASTPHLNLSFLLAYDATRDPFYRQLRLPYRHAVHDHGAVLINYLRNRNGISSLHALAASLRNRRPEQSAAQMLECAFAASVAEINAAVCGAPPAGPPQKPIPPDFVSELVSATLRYDRAAVNACARRLAVWAPLETTDDPQALACWLRILNYRLMASYWWGGADSTQTAKLTALSSRAAAASAPQHLLLLSSAVAEISQLSALDDDIAILSRIAVIEDIFAKARLCAPSDIEVRFAQARFALMNLSASAPLDEEASAVLAELMLDENYGADIRAAVTAMGGVTAFCTARTVERTMREG